MTQRNGTGGKSDHLLHSESAGACAKAKGLEEEKVQEAWYCESEAGGHGGERRDSVAVTGEVIAPDGGWGWVVLVATIMVLALTLGFPTCVGIFYTDLQNDFHASNSETSWVPSIMTSVLHAGGNHTSVSFLLVTSFISVALLQSSHAPVVVIITTSRSFEFLPVVVVWIKCET